MIVLGEFDLDFDVLVGLLACELIFKAGYELTGAELEAVVFVLAALECDAVNEAFLIYDDGVAHGGSSVGDGNEAGILILISF